MPADRVQARNSGRTTARSSPRNRPRLSSSNTDDSVCILSSPSDEDSRARSTKKRSAPPKTTQRPSRPSETTVVEVIDISSDEDDKPTTKGNNKPASCSRPPISSTRAGEQPGSHDRVAQREIQNLKADLARLRERQKGKSLVDSSELEDLVTCEICAGKMWSPYMTPNCGHSFCGTCLKAWFETTLRQHVGLHPTYNVNMQLPMELLAWARDPRYAGIVAQRLQEMGIPGHPTYTCPHCRGKVTEPPTENRALKAMVRMAASAAGEHSPKKPTSTDMVKHNERLWGQFFPKEKLRPNHS